MLDELVCALNRALVTWSPWAPGDNEAVRVATLHRVNHKFGNKLLPIVCIIEETTNNICSDIVTFTIQVIVVVKSSHTCMENVRIPHKAKVFLQLIRNKLGSFPWECGKIHKTS